MAAALFRRGTRLCCIHRELCRLVWRPQSALFSSKPSDPKQPRRTHIKKAKAQPAVDVAKLLEQLFPQRRLSTAPPAARPTNPPTASSVNVSSSNVPPLSKTEPAASSVKQVDAQSLPTVTVPTTSGSSPTSAASLASGAAAVEYQTVETSIETAPEPVELKAATQLPLSDHVVEKIAEASSSPAAAVEPLIETTIEVEQILSHPVEPTVEAPAEEVQTDISYSAKVEPLIETTIEPAVEASHFTEGTLETRAAVVEGPVESTLDVTVDVAARTVETDSTDSGGVDVSHTTTVEPLIETTIEPASEKSASLLETLENRSAVADGSVETTIEAEADTAALSVETKNSDSRTVNLSHAAEEEPLIETTIEPAVETSHFTEGTLETRAAVVEGAVESTIDVTVETKNSDSGPVNFSHAAEVEPLIETTRESPVETSHFTEGTLETSAAVVEGPVESTIDVTVDVAAQKVETDSTDSGPVNLSHTLIETTIESPVETSHFTEGTLETRAAVVEGAVESTIDVTVETNSTDSGPVNLSHAAEEEALIESTIEPTVESVNVAAEEGVTGSEEMTLESVTLFVHEVQVTSLNTDELLQTKSILDEKVRELSVQMENNGENEAAAETENSREEESDTLTFKGLSRWDSMSEDLQELEGESNKLELLCHVPLETPGSVGTSSPVDPAVGEQTEEKATMTLESITLAEVTAGVGGLEAEVLLETRNALEDDADVLAKEEKMEVRTATDEEAIFEEMFKAESAALDSISEATDAIEDEAAVVMEAMLGLKQGPRRPWDDVQEESKVEQRGDVLEAMSLESVTLAEVEASLRTLESESLSETTSYLEKEAELVAGEKKTEAEAEVEVEDAVQSEEATKVSLLAAAEDLSEDLQIDALMEELLFSVPGPRTGGQEAVRADTLDAAVVSSGSVDVEAAAAVTDDLLASPALKEVLLEEEKEEKEEEEGDEDGKGTHADLDPVQRLFLEKIKEYNNMRRLNGGPLEAEPGYEKYVSEETAKLQRLYGGGDLSSFPEFTFTEPQLDQDSK